MQAWAAANASDMSLMNPTAAAAAVAAQLDGTLDGNPLAKFLNDELAGGANANASTAASIRAGNIGSYASSCNNV